MTKRKVNNGIIYLKDNIRVRYKTPRYNGKYKWAKEIHQKTETYRKTGEERRVLREFDRLKNKYKEIIIKSDGTTIKNVEEPLTNHKGHGNAKRKNVRN